MTDIEIHVRNFMQDQNKVNRSQGAVRRQIMTVEYSSPSNLVLGARVSGNSITNNLMSGQRPMISNPLERAAAIPQAQPSHLRRHRH
jgi:hypothetical protein